MSFPLMCFLCMDCVTMLTPAQLQDGTINQAELSAYLFEDEEEVHVMPLSFNTNLNALPCSFLLNDLLAE